MVVFVFSITHAIVAEAPSSHGRIRKDGKDQSRSRSLRSSFLLTPPKSWGGTGHSRFDLHTRITHPVLVEGRNQSHPIQKEQHHSLAALNGGPFCLPPPSMAALLRRRRKFGSGVFRPTIPRCQLRRLSLFLGPQNPTMDPWAPGIFDRA